MNIFALSKDPEESATQMIDKHVIKMPTETCQMLHTNIIYMEYVQAYGKEPQLKDLKRFHKQTESKLMKPAMLNHPSTIWARQSIANFHWLYQHGLALCEEYTLRYGKRHGSHDRIIIGMRRRDNINYSFPHTGLTPVTIAMFDKYRLDENEYYNRNPNAKDWDFVIASYKHYYLTGKWEFASWKTSPPNWWPKNHYDNMMAKKVEAFNRTYNAKLEEE
ncbi:pyrimidine dimer DNA glycosylase/endonuclease V [bacterium]|jgi:hypothetical protein|nr:pyrimidine dimer DNA glycosylase/endonuclease V [bacterium]